MQAAGFWQTWVMHCVPGGHCAFVWQKRCGWQTPFTHTNPKLQSADVPHVNGWQKPNLHCCPAGQSPLVAHCGCGTQTRASGAQNSPGGQGVPGPQATTGVH